MDRLSCLLTEVSNKTKSRLSQRLKTYNITCRQAVALAVIKENTLSASKIGEISGIDKATLSLILNKLIEHKFVICNINKEDKREKMYAITQEGINVLYATEKIEKECRDEFLEKLTEDEYETLIDLLDKLI